jgi:hypothetical protein
MKDFGSGRRTALVTGASSGLGRATAAMLTQRFRAATNAQHHIGDYDGVREGASRTLHEGLHRGDDRRKCAELVLAIAESARPRRRYGVGPQARWLPLLTSLVPQRLFGRILRRSFGLPRRPT